MKSEHKPEEEAGFVRAVEPTQDRMGSASGDDLADPPGLSDSDVALIASRALKGENIDRVSSYRTEVMNVLSIGNGTKGLWKVTGTAQTGSKTKDWSAVLKILDPAGVTVENLGFQNAKREINALSSADLLGIKTGMRPAPIYGLGKRENGDYWLWMKDLSAAVQPPWSGDQFVATARHVGQFNGLWSERGRPKGTWIATDMSTDRRSGITGMMAQDYRFLSENRNHPMIRRFWTQSQVERAVRLLDDADRLVHATRNLERFVAHNDCHARNLFPSVEQGEDVTYAIDWASVGLAPIGVDGGSLFGASLTWSQGEVSAIEEREGDVFAAYVAGLRDSGWDGDDRKVRLAYLSQVATYLVFFPFVAAISVQSNYPLRPFFRTRMGIEGAEAVDEAVRRLAQFGHLVDEGMSLID